jgi:hypothetical protein
MKSEESNDQAVGQANAEAEAEAEAYSIDKRPRPVLEGLQTASCDDTASALQWKAERGMLEGVKTSQIGVTCAPQKYVLKSIGDVASCQDAR